MMTENAADYRSGGDDPLEAVAERLALDPGYMAWMLRKFRMGEGWQVERLLAHLGVERRTYVRLALCKRPAADAPDFAEQVREIAEYTQVALSTLVSLIRQVDALEGLQPRRVEGRSGQAIPGYVETPRLAAARDRMLHESRSDSPEELAARVLRTLHKKGDESLSAQSAQQPTRSPASGDHSDSSDQEESPDDPAPKPDEPLAGQ